MPLVLGVVGEQMYTCQDTRKKSCEKGSNQHWFGSVCRLSAVALEIKLHKQTLHRKNDIKQKGQAPNHRFPAYIKTIQQSFLKAQFLVTAKSICVWMKLNHMMKAAFGTIPMYMWTRLLEAV